MKTKLIQNYQSKVYALAKSESKYMQKDYEVFARHDFERRLNYILMDIEQALKK